MHGTIPFMRDPRQPTNYCIIERISARGGGGGGEKLQQAFSSISTQEFSLYARSFPCTYYYELQQLPTTKHICCNSNPVCSEDTIGHGCAMIL